jgi:hypothetical protein
METNAPSFLTSELPSDGEALFESFLRVYASFSTTAWSVCLSQSRYDPPTHWTTPLLSKGGMLTSRLFNEMLKFMGTHARHIELSVVANDPS